MPGNYIADVLMEYNMHRQESRDKYLKDKVFRGKVKDAFRKEMMSINFEGVQNTQEFLQGKQTAFFETFKMLRQAFPNNEKQLKKKWNTLGRKSDYQIGHLAHADIHEVQLVQWSCAVDRLKESFCIWLALDLNGEVNGLVTY